MAKASLNMQAALFKNAIFTDRVMVGAEIVAQEVFVESPDTFGFQARVQFAHQVLNDPFGMAPRFAAAVAAQGWLAEQDLASDAADTMILAIVRDLWNPLCGVLTPPP